MTSKLPATIPNALPVERARLKNTRLGPGLSRKRVDLIECMIFEGLSRKEAAAKVTMTDRAARFAMRDKNFMGAYQQQLAILRESEKPKSVHKLAELRDQSKSLKTSFEAAKFLASDEHKGSNIQVNVGVRVEPGYICDVSKVAERSRRILEESRG